jgi:hypothetical protein
MLICGNAAIKMSKCCSRDRWSRRFPTPPVSATEVEGEIANYKLTMIPLLFCSSDERCPYRIVAEGTDVTLTE